MENPCFEMISVAEIAANPHNPRKRFDDEDFKRLVKSVREKGVLQPVLVRPFPAWEALETPDSKKYQLVAGERRWRALCEAASQNGGMVTAMIPAMVREMTDDEAFDLMMIENLQRQDLTELEEAEGFKAFLVRHGDQSADDLAERTGIHARYIRRRVAILKLPAEVLKAWEKGNILYGHCEQLSRLEDKNEVLAWLKRCLDRRLRVQDLAGELMDEAPLLKDAKFDIEKAGCKTCGQNSDIQKKLFDLGKKSEARCLNQKCFKKRLNDYLQANWKKTGWYKQYHTTGFRFQDNYPHYGELNNFGWTGATHGGEACRTCDKFVTIIRLNGKASIPVACIGDRACFDKTTREALNQRRKKTKGEKSDDKAGDSPRAGWHGEHFRQEFFKKQIRAKFSPEDVGGRQFTRINLMGLIQGYHQFLPQWFADTYLDGAGHRNNWLSIGDDEIWRGIQALGPIMLDEAVCEACLKIIENGPISGETRQGIAVFLGINLAKEWTPTKEYLDKKTIGEIHAWAEQHGIWETPEAKKYLFENLNKKRGAFKSCKKTELTELILNCGLDLAGKLFKEIELANEADEIEPDAEEEYEP